jgi:hypothetical protein
MNLDLKTPKILETTATLKTSVMSGEIGDICNTESIPILIEIHNISSLHILFSVV